MESHLASLGRAFGAPARCRMVAVLLDGADHAAGELAVVAGVTAATASEHLAVLVDTGWIASRRQGRHRLYRLSDARIAHALELVAAADPLPPVRSLRAAREQARVRAARTCYDHLAGQLGVAIARDAVDAAWLTEGLGGVTAHGRSALHDAFDIDVEALCRGRRTLVRPCLDWTEQRHHIAGSLGAALAACALERAWVRRRAGSRGLTVTPSGERAFAALGVAVDGTPG